VAQIEEQLGPVDLLIPAAGIGRETSALNLRAEDMEAVIRVNLIGVSHSIAAVLPGMMRRRRGHIVALSSLASYRGLPLMAGYCASKAGVNALMESLRVELRQYNILFTTICPGWIRTPMTAGLGIPMPDLMEVETASQHILDAIRRRRVFYAFPPRLARRLQLLRWLPLRLSDWLIARMLRKLKEG
jgi:short-subunit dehydrogenase